MVDVVTGILLEYGELISPIVIKPEEFKNRNDSFIRTVLEEGKPLYSSGFITRFFKTGLLRPPRETSRPLRGRSRGGAL